MGLSSTDELSIAHLKVLLHAGSLLQMWDHPMHHRPQLHHSQVRIDDQMEGEDAVAEIRAHDEGARSSITGSLSLLHEALELGILGVRDQPHLRRKRSVQATGN